MYTPGEKATMIVALERIAADLAGGGVRAGTARNSLNRAGGLTHEDRIKELIELIKKSS